MSTLGIGIIGFGFMGRTHLEAYRRAAADRFDCQVKAIYSLDPPGFGGGGNVQTGADDEVDLDALGIRWSEQIGQLLEADDIDLVSICTPTDTHIDLAIEFATDAIVLDRGKVVWRGTTEELGADEAMQASLLGVGVEDGG